MLKSHAVLLSALLCLAYASNTDPLQCFTEEPGNSPTKVPNTCFGQYKLQHPEITTTAACASLCLSDAACVQFVWALGGEQGPKCRLSHTCTTPTGFLAGFNGYTRSKVAGCAVPPPTAFGFHAPLFSDGMILQRGAATKVWGSGAQPGATVKVSVSSATPKAVFSTGAATASETGDWSATLSNVLATQSGTVTATDGSASAVLKDVAIGDVVLCGGQSNMGFGMCGSTSKTQTPQQALDDLNSGVRFYFQAGSGPNGGRGGCKTSSGAESITTAYRWSKANATNSGGFSAVCMLTAQYLFQSMEGKVPVGAVESCISGTNVEPWTPPSGSLYSQHIVPLLPMTFQFVLWDQGEADAKRTSSSYYATEFPKLVTGWRQAFESPTLPFFYVELCTEYGAEEPREAAFWDAQRSVLALPRTGFAVTTDIQRALHPPDKQDVANRLLLEVQRVAYSLPVVSRGPELVAHNGSAVDDSTVEVTITFSNASLTVHEGIFVGAPGACTTPFEQQSGASRTAAAYKIYGSHVVVACTANSTVLVNSDTADCFLYSNETGLPAPPISVPCSA